MGGYRDLEEWEYFEDGYTAWYLSPSQRLVIIRDPQLAGSCWLWRVYDNGVPQADGADILADTFWDHELGYFDTPYDAYDDVRNKGMERTGY